mmetsp:Transcript_19169/g.31375  ORF Transcript_19169/g.31375 Transcript_19169/m.31375 type:complete len:872 (-) Transcript_19169:255-2870(-)
METKDVVAEDSATALPGDLNLLYEEEILRNPFSLKLWWRYLQAMKGSTPRHRNVLYERSLKQLPGSYKLWRAYLRERREQVRGLPVNHKAYNAVNNVFERALVFLHKMPCIWLDFLQFLMDQRLGTRTRHAFDRALRSVAITQHDRIWDLYLKFARELGVPETAIRVYRRHLKLEPAHVEEYVDYLLNIKHVDEAAKLMVQAINRDDFVSLQGKNRHQLWTEVCDLISKNPDKVKSLKVDPIIRSGLVKFTDEVGRMWAALADFYIRLGHFEKARDIYEEALDKVITVRDFSLLFDAYAQFEESVIAAKMETRDEKADGVADDDLDEDGDDLDLRLARLERLMDRRPALLSSVLLRQNPHNVHEWHKRIKIFSKDPEKVVRVYTEACKTVDPQRAVGKPHTLWVAFAKFYEQHEDVDNARLIFEKAIQINYRAVDDLASVWCEYTELELRAMQFERALKLMHRATMPPLRKKNMKSVNEIYEEVAVQERLYRSTKLWTFYVDLEESLGTFASTKAVYDKILELKIATPQIIINYAHFLEENKYFEESFKVYEQGVNIFGFPHAMDIWLTYLNKFVGRYGGKKLERARDLYEQALEKCPALDAKVLYLSYAKLEEDYGLARHAMAVYDRAVKALPDDQKYDMFQTYIGRAAELFGVAKTREIYELAVEIVAEKRVKDICVKYAELERKLGEIDRARAIYVHAAQFCDPRVELKFWQTWNDFEVQHGNEDTFRDMLRIKRSVQATYTQVTFAAADMLNAAKQADEDNVAKRRKTDNDAMEALDRMAEAPTPHITRPQQLSSGGPLALEQGQENPEEMDISDVQANGTEEGLEIESMPVPSAVFGELASVAEEGNSGGGGGGGGALARFKARKK